MLAEFAIGKPFQAPYFCHLKLKVLPPHLFFEHPPNFEGSDVAAGRCSIASTPYTYPFEVMCMFPSDGNFEVPRSYASLRLADHAFVSYGWSHFFLCAKKVREDRAE